MDGLRLSSMNRRGFLSGLTGFLAATLGYACVARDRIEVGTTVVSPEHGLGEIIRIVQPEGMAGTSYPGVPGYTVHFPALGHRTGREIGTHGLLVPRTAVTRSPKQTRLYVHA